VQNQVLVVIEGSSSVKPLPAERCWQSHTPQHVECYGV